MSSEFTVRHLKYKYSQNSDLVISDLSCEIRKGSFTCIVGKNGSGKTTFVKLLAGILNPTEGTIEKSCERCAIIFQNPDNQFVSNIVEEDVAFGPENLCFPPEKIREVVDSSLNTVGMIQYREKSISSLSAGEKQGVAIAGALAVSPDCIILDEPSCLFGLKKKKNTTLICVTQNPEIALEADRILIMNDGKFAANITPKEFVKNFEKYEDCGIVLPESVKLISMLDKIGYDTAAIKEELKKQ